MRFGSLFSGVGGMDLGLERAGMECAWQVEIDDYCLKVLTNHWPDVPKFGDIKECGSHNLEPIDLICGGFPCQDISYAGKGAGIAEGTRSGLWREFHRIICELRPRIVLVENVPALLARGLGRVLGDLAESGYDAEWDCIPAQSVGAHHRRDRVFIVAYSESQRSGEAGELRREQSQKRASGCGEEMADTNRTGLPKSTRGQFGSIFGAAGPSARSELGGGASAPGDYWTVEPNVGRVVDGLSAELDFARQITRWCHENRNNPKTQSTRNELVRKMLFAMWENRELATTSPTLYIERLRNSVPEVPLQDSQSRWFLGSRIEEEEDVRNMWGAFSTEPFEKAQDVQFRMLERDWSQKRGKTVGSRVSRLKGLGNAVVPQVAEFIGRLIMDAERGEK